MDDAELQAERELAADLDRMAHTVCAGLQTAEPASVWMERRRKIATLRERIRVMRARHVGSETPPWPRPHRAPIV
jgi:hypothetical protein